MPPNDSGPGIWRISLGNGKPGWKIVRGEEADRIDALRVRQQVYCEELGYNWQSPEDGLDARGTLCVVRNKDEEAIASLRIVGPEARPYEIERFISVEHILPPDSRAAELNRFCILPAYRRMSSSVHVALFTFMFGLARRERFSHFILASKRSIAAIYRYLLFEEVKGYEFLHSELADSPHDIYLLELHNLVDRYKAASHPWVRLLEQGGASQW